MASVSISHLVLFIASMLVASTVAVTFATQGEELAGALDRKGEDMSREIRSDVEIISDPASAVYNTSGNENVTILVKNTGSRELPKKNSLQDVLVNGEYQTNVSLTVLDGDDWGQTNVVRMNISVDGGLSSGDHRVKVIVEGDEEVFEFRT